VQSTLRSFDLAHLAHVELLTPKPDESLRFFVDVMGMTESGRRGSSVYLRGWDDYEHHTLKLTAADVAGMGHFAYRATSPEALQRRVATIERSGRGSGWTEGDLGHGPAYAFTTPDGHAMELYYETEWYSPPPELQPSLKNQAQRFPARGMKRFCNVTLPLSLLFGIRRLATLFRQPVRAIAEFVRPPALHGATN
jgi:catechol 2,3-dioxygenase